MEEGGTRRSWADLDVVIEIERAPLAALAEDFCLRRDRDRLYLCIRHCSPALGENGPLCALSVCPARERLGIRSHLSFPFLPCPCSCQTSTLGSHSPCAGSIGALSSLWLGKGFATGLERLWGQCDTGEHHGTAREPGALPGLALLGGAEIGPIWRRHRLNAQRGVGVRSYLKAGSRVRDPNTLGLSWCGA